MAKKAKKRVHPMPKLGWKDQVLYWSVMIFSFGGAIVSIFFPIYYQEKLVFQNPDVISHVSGEGSFHFFWLTIWLSTFGLIVATAFYQYRTPIFGRSDIKYGPPVYPRIYPLLMKNKPKYWQSPKKLAQKKKNNTIFAVVILASLLFSAAMYPRSLYGRFELLYDGTVVCYDSYNRESAHYRLSDMESVCLDAALNSGRNRNYWYARITFTFSDGESCNYSIRTLGDDWEDAIQTALKLKARYGDLVSIEDADQLWRVVDDQDLNPTEEDLLYQLFGLE